MAQACPRCNNQVEVGANFCPKCGKDMSAVVPQYQSVPTEDFPLRTVYKRIRLGRYQAKKQGSRYLINEKSLRPAAPDKSSNHRDKIDRDVFTKGMDYWFEVSEYHGLDCQPVPRDKTIDAIATLAAPLADLVQAGTGTAVKAIGTLTRSGTTSAELFEVLRPYIPRVDLVGVKPGSWNKNPKLVAVIYADDISWETIMQWCAEFTSGRALKALAELRFSIAGMHPQLETNLFEIVVLLPYFNTRKFEEHSENTEVPDGRRRYGIYFTTVPIDVPNRRFESDYKEYEYWDNQVFSPTDLDVVIKMGLKQ